VTIKKPTTYSWVPPDVTWSERLDILALEIHLSDTKLVRFMAEGFLDVYIYSSMKMAKCMCLLLGHHLESNLTLAFSGDHNLVHLFPEAGDSNTMRIYWHGSLLLPEEEKVLVLVGADKPSTNSLIKYEALRNQAKEVFEKYQQELSIFDEETEKKRKEKQESHAKYPKLKKYDFGLEEHRRLHQQPTVTAEPLTPLFPKGIYFQLGRKTSVSSISAESMRCARESDWSLPRAGQFEVCATKNAEWRKVLIMTWVPYDGLPAYPEVRWALQKRLLSAFQKPRRITSSRPSIVGTSNRLRNIQLDGDSGNDWYDELRDLQLDDANYTDRISTVKGDLNQSGFEAIAWYQPYHIWSEDTWGIYFDAAKLDDFALAIFDECRQQKARCNFDLCAQLAFGLIYNHEYFHARVEASLSWLELNALYPRQIKYKEDVYQRLSGTDDWLEEALANWASWRWSRAYLKKAQQFGAQDNEKLNCAIEAILDLSPAGYNNWRAGHQKASWRRLTTQMVSGEATIQEKKVLPLDSLLAESLPYDLRQSDIPLFFVGHGQIAGRLDSLPYVINVPTRKEIERALRYFEYVLNAAGGKGSHEKWIGPDNRAFTLPRRDPLSRGVFKSFLEHFRIDKITYASKIRPNL